MAGVPIARTDLSTTASSNSPAGTDLVGANTGPDDYIRALSSLIRLNYDDVVLKAPIASPTFTGTVTLPTTWKIGSTSVAATAAQIDAACVTYPPSSGTYTPTVTGGPGAPITSTTARVTQYLRVGSVVTVSGSCSITSSSTSSMTFTITLPVASNLASAFQLSGMVGSPSTSSTAVVTGDVTDDVATITIAGTNSAAEFYFHFTYLIV